MARVGLLVAGTACLALAAVCAVLMTPQRPFGSDILLAKLPQHAGQKSELAALLKRQLNDQVQAQESQMFHSTLQQEGIADALKKEGFELPHSLNKVAVHSARSMHRSRMVQKRLRVAAEAARRARQVDESSAQENVPLDVKLAQQILHGKVTNDLPLKSKVVPKSKLILNTVIEAKSSSAGRKQAKADAYLKHNVQEADEITKLVNNHHASSTAPKFDEKMDMEIASAAELMNTLGPHSGVAQRKQARQTSSDNSEEAAIEAALRAKLNAAVQHRETNMYIRSVSNRVSHLSSKSNPSSDSFQLASQSIKEVEPSRLLHDAHGKRPAGSMTRIELEHALKDKLDDITQNLQQKDLYKTELRTAPAQPSQVAAAPSVPPLSQSTFGGLDIKRSPESSLEEELRAQLNSNVQSQEQHLFRSDAKDLLH